MELVVGASESSMKSLLGKLGGLLAQEYALVRGVRGDVQYIYNELATMQAFLRDLSSSPEEQDHRMKDWMKQIRDMAYDCEDCIDDYAHRLPNDSNNSDVKCSFIIRLIYEVWTWWPRREIAANISDLKIRAQQIAERRGRYGVDNPSNCNGNSSGAHAAAYDIAEHQVGSRQLIGIKEPVGMITYMKELEEWVDKPDEQHGVLSIIGFGGVGKTTIATALYRKVTNKFECRASVNVSQNYDKDAVLRSILKQVMPQDRVQEEESTREGSLEKKHLAVQVLDTLKRAVPSIRGNKKQGNDGSSDEKQIKIETMDSDKLIDEVKEHMKEKRYLLLIDDIWSTRTWESIRNCLPRDNRKRSRIIVTSRFQAVGAACSPSGTSNLLHTVDLLKTDESKDLFHQSVTESNGSKHSEEEKDKGPEEILKICGRLPLAIVTMAGLVACNPNKPNGNNWGKVCKQIFPEPMTTLSLDGVKRILDFCYNDLPGDLKTCALYLSIFPKGSKISMKRLTRRLTAEGFVSEKQGLTEEEVAETYFNQLMRRKLIRPVEHNSNGKVKAFQVHDMVLEYIVSKSSEENFITVVGGHWMMQPPSNKVRRLSMQSSGSKHENMTKNINLSQVRSVTVFGSLKQLPFHSFNNGIIQVLDLEGWKGLKERHVKNDICKMLMLKYLSLRRTEIAKIPKKIVKLECLETLDIRETHVEELPKSAEKLKRISSILGGNKNPRKGLRLPQDKNKESKKITSPQEEIKDSGKSTMLQGESKESEESILPQENESEKKSLSDQEKNVGMKELRVLSGIEIVGGSTAVDGLHQMTGLKKLAIYKLHIKKDTKIFRQLLSSIEYLCSCGLQTLAINDEDSDFINSLDSMFAPPRYLIALELSGNKLERPPKWVCELHTLSKLTLSVTVLRTDTFKLVKDLPSLFSLTFSLSAAKQNPDKIKDILEKNKSDSDGEIFVPAGFPSLKLLRFFAPRVPKLGFGDNAMPALDMIQLRFEAFEGLFGIDTLESLREVHLRVNGQAAELKESDEAETQETEAPEMKERKEAAEITRFLVEDLKNYTTERLKVIVDYIVNA
ncbi:unnamed protein product [Urochloa decumbens]|uniref:Uncharacterized protein n=1 Tax=Urochloa decumbens TaxID=240449 RepID=A0ABC9AQY1_9POAL